MRHGWLLLAAVGVTAALLAGGRMVRGASVKFVPPDEKARKTAIGSLEGLPPQLVRAFSPETPPGAFKPIETPGPSDWLANHSESLESYDDWLASEPNFPDKKRNTLYLQVLGSVPDDRKTILDKVEQFAGIYFQMPVKLMSASDLKNEKITKRINPGTKKEQLLSTDILTMLANKLPDDAYALLGVTFTDLYPDPSWNFVFGQASLTRRVGVYSFARYDPAFFGEKAPKNVDDLILLRSCKVLAHETGHMFGIGHCTYFSCLMNGSNHMQESDSRPIHECPIDLRKLHRSIAFDTVKRYKDLRDFWKANNNPDEVKWLESRIAAIEAK